PDVFDKTLLLITYDEHGGLYDHVPPPTGVPSPGGPISGVGRVQRALLYRKCAAFDFTMLGPRVPAVALSPRGRAGPVGTHRPRQHPAHAAGPVRPPAAPADRRGPVVGAVPQPAPAARGPRRPARPARAPPPPHPRDQPAACPPPARRGPHRDRRGPHRDRR